MNSQRAGAVPLTASVGNADGERYTSPAMHKEIKSRIGKIAIQHLEAGLDIFPTEAQMMRLVATDENVVGLMERMGDTQPARGYSQSFQQFWTRDCKATPGGRALFKSLYQGQLNTKNSVSVSPWPSKKRRDGLGLVRLTPLHPPPSPSTRPFQKWSVYQAVGGAPKGGDMQRWSTLSLGSTDAFFRQGTATDGEPVSELPLVAAVAAAWDKDALAKDNTQILRRVNCTLDQLAMTCWKVGGWASGLCWGTL
jgi:hypothetical protein